MSIRSFSVVLAVAASIGQSAKPPNPRDPTGTATITGQVIDDTSGQPVAGVRVTRWLVPSGAAFQHEAITDAQGRFLFRDVGAGSYRVVAETPGYATGAYGRRRNGGPDRILMVSDGEHVAAIVLRVFKPARSSIAGTITDHDGEPAAGVTVVLLRRRAGTEASSDPVWDFPSTTQTDDRGRYRFALGLFPGERADCLVVVPPATVLTVAASEAAHARPPATPQPGFSTKVVVPGRPPIVASDWRVFAGDPARPSLVPELAPIGTSRVYPVSFQAGAGPESGSVLTTVESDTERTGMDIQLSLVRAVRISGRVEGPSGPVARVDVRIVPAFVDNFTQGSDAGFDIAQSITDESGRFMMFGVAPGRSILRVRLAPEAPQPTASGAGIEGVAGQSLPMSGSQAAPPAEAPFGPTLLADVPLDVAAADIEDLRVVLKRGASISGRIAFDAAGPLPAPAAIARISAWLQPFGVTPIGFPLYRADASGQFTSAEYPPGRYSVNTLPPSGWVVKSAMYRDHDLYVEPLTLGTESLDGVVVTFTDKVATMAGTVRTDKGAPDPDATVLLFPVGYRLRGGVGFPVERLKQAAVTEAGAFSVKDLLPGEYFVIAVGDYPTGNWRQASSLTALARMATRVTIKEGDARTQDLRTQVVR